MRTRVFKSLPLACPSTYLVLCRNLVCLPTTPEFTLQHSSQEPNKGSTGLPGAALSLRVLA